MSEICLQVMAAIQAILGAQVAVGAPLMSAGLDSLGAVELLNELTRSAIQCRRILMFKKCDTSDPDTDREIQPCGLAGFYPGSVFSGHAALISCLVLKLVSQQPWDNVTG